MYSHAFHVGRCFKEVGGKGFQWGEVHRTVKIFNTGVSSICCANRERFVRRVTGRGTITANECIRWHVGTFSPHVSLHVKPRRDVRQSIGDEVDGRTSCWTSNQPLRNQIYYGYKTRLWRRKQTHNHPAGWFKDSMNQARR